MIERSSNTYVLVLLRVAPCTHARIRVRTRIIHSSTNVFLITDYVTIARGEILSARLRSNFSPANRDRVSSFAEITIGANFALRSCIKGSSPLVNNFRH